MYRIQILLRIRGKSIKIFLLSLHVFFSLKDSLYSILFLIKSLIILKEENKVDGQLAAHINFALTIAILPLEEVGGRKPSTTLQKESTWDQSSFVLENGIL